jgi:hypothetical protein
MLAIVLHQDMFDYYNSIKTMRDESTVARVASWFGSIMMLIEAVSNWKHMAGGYGTQTHGTNWKYHIGRKHMEAARRKYPSQCSRQWGKRV